MKLSAAILRRHRVGSGDSVAISQRFATGLLAATARTAYIPRYVCNKMGNATSDPRPYDAVASLAGGCYTTTQTILLLFLHFEPSISIAMGYFALLSPQHRLLSWSVVFPSHQLSWQSISNHALKLLVADLQTAGVRAKRGDSEKCYK